LPTDVLDFRHRIHVLLVAPFVLDEGGMGSLDNHPDFVVFEQEIVVGDVGDDVAGEDILPPAIRRADSTGSGVEHFGDVLHHVVDYGRGHGFGGVGYIQ